MAARAAPTLQQVRARATAARADLLLFGDHSNNLTVKQGKRGKFAGPGPVSSPWRDRTAYLLLTIYPRDDAVANCEDAGQARAGALCCRPTYLFITPAMWAATPLRPTTEGKQARRRIVPTYRLRA